MCKETGILCYFIQATGLLILQERREAQALVYFRACPWEGRGQGPPKPALHCLPLPAWTLTVALHGRALDTVCAEDVHVHQLGVTHKLKRDLAHLVQCVHGQTAFFLQLSADRRVERR